jgi:hypothetical protein
MEKTIIITGLVVILAIYIMLMIVVSYLRLIIRKLDRVRDCTPKAIISPIFVDELKAENGRLRGTVFRLNQNIAGLKIDNEGKAHRIRELKIELEKLHKERSGE